MTLLAKVVFSLTKNKIKKLKILIHKNQNYHFLAYNKNLE